MWWIIITSFILLVILYLFFAPFFIEVNSDTGLFRIRFHRLASANFSFNEKSIYIRFEMAGWQKQIDLLKANKREKKPADKKGKTKSKMIPLQKILAVINSFKIRKFSLSVDTGNMQMNGVLFPVFTLMSVKSGKDITINFFDENRLVLQMENSIARMMWAFFKS